MPFWTILWASLSDFTRGLVPNLREADGCPYVEEGLDTLGVLRRLHQVSNWLLSCRLTMMPLPSLRLSAHKCVDTKRKFGDRGSWSRSYKDPCLRQASSPSRQSPLHSLALFDGYNLKDMSRAAKLTLAGTSIGAIGIVALVHYQQNSEKAVSFPSTMDFFDPIVLINRLTFYRQCMRELYVISNSKGSRKNGRRISICRGRWRKSIGRCSRCMMVRESRRRLGIRADAARGGTLSSMAFDSQSICGKKGRYFLFARPGGRTGSTPYRGKKRRKVACREITHD